MPVCVMHIALVSEHPQHLVSGSVDFVRGCSICHFLSLQVKNHVSSIFFMRVIDFYCFCFLLEKKYKLEGFPPPIIDSYSM